MSDDEWEEQLNDERQEWIDNKMFEINDIDLDIE